MRKQKKKKKKQIFWLQQNNLLFKAQSGPSAGTEMLNQLNTLISVWKWTDWNIIFLGILFMLDNIILGPRQLTQQHESWYFHKASLLTRASLLDWLKLAFAGHFSCQVPEQAEIPINFYIWFCFFYKNTIDYCLKDIKNVWMFSLDILLSLKQLHSSEALASRNGQNVGPSPQLLVNTYKCEILSQVLSIFQEKWSFTAWAEVKDWYVTILYYPQCNPSAW